jgi:hypothetical protein
VWKFDNLFIYLFVGAQLQHSTVCLYYCTQVNSHTKRFELVLFETADGRVNRTGREARTMSESSANDSLLHPADPAARQTSRGVTPRPPVTPGRLLVRERRRPVGALLAGNSAQVRRVVESALEQRSHRDSSRTRYLGPVRNTASANGTRLRRVSFMKLFCTKMDYKKLYL